MRHCTHEQPTGIVMPGFITPEFVFWWFATWPFKYAAWVLFADWVDRRRRRKDALLPKTLENSHIRPDYSNNWGEELVQLKRWGS